MKNKKFNQKPLSINEQIALLEKRHLSITDFSEAAHFLRVIGYHRLTFYFQPFFDDPNGVRNTFKQGACFRDIILLYNFDRELRLLVSDAIERIEVALRTALSNILSKHYGAHWYLNKACFKNTKLYDIFISEVIQCIKRSNDRCIKEYYKSFSMPDHPPSWMVVECLPFSSLSKAFSNLKERKIRKEIGDSFGQFSEILKSWMRSLTFTRNICAHHARLWNRNFVYKPKMVQVDLIDSRNISPFSMQAKVIKALINQIAPGNHWINRLYLLFEEHETLISFTEMGFIENWSNDSTWE